MITLSRSRPWLVLVGAGILVPISLSAQATPQHGLCHTPPAIGSYQATEGPNNNLSIMEHDNRELAARGVPPACRWREVDGGLVRSGSGECARWQR